MRGGAPEKAEAAGADTSLREHAATLRWSCRRRCRSRRRGEQERAPPPARVGGTRGGVVDRGRYLICRPGLGSVDRWIQRLRQGFDTTNQLPRRARASSRALCPRPPLVGASPSVAPRALNLGGRRDRVGVVTRGGGRSVGERRSWPVGAVAARRRQAWVPGRGERPTARSRIPPRSASPTSTASTR